MKATSLLVLIINISQWKN